MVSCWAPKPEDRPSFEVLKTQLEQMLEQIVEQNQPAENEKGLNSMKSHTEESIEMEDIDMYI